MDAFTDQEPEITSYDDTSVYSGLLKIHSGANKRFGYRLNDEKCILYIKSSDATARQTILAFDSSRGVKGSGCTLSQ